MQGCLDFLPVNYAIRRNTSCSLTAAVGLLSFSLGVSGADFCVGNSRDLQNALVAATTNGEADRIALVKSTYAGNFRYESAEGQALELLGGYDPGCRSRTVDPTNTKLIGAGNGEVFTFTGGPGAGFTLEGVTVSGGNPTSEYLGAGLNVFTSSEPLVEVLLNQNRFADNSGTGAYIDADGVIVSNSSFEDNAGGGVSVSGGIVGVNIANNSFSRNQGAGIGIYASHGYAILTGNRFSDNGGGASVSGFGCGATFSDNSFTGNGTAESSGHAISVDCYRGSAVLNRNRLVGNQGGGAYVDAGGGGTATLIGNRFFNNAAPEYGGGAYVTTWAGRSTITNNRFVGNVATMGGGAIYVESAFFTTLTNNRFVDNETAGYGGGAYFSAYTDENILTNNSFTGNLAGDGGGLGLYVQSNNTVLSNNLFWNNAATGNGDDLWIDNDPDGDLLPSQPVLMHNAFDQAIPAGFYVTDPIRLDPSNMDALDPVFGDEDQHLSARSPMINAGDRSAPALPMADIDGDPRIAGRTVDIGADEYVALTVDFGADGLWHYDETWRQLTNWDPGAAGITGWTNGLAADFDDAGLWGCEGMLTSRDPGDVIEGWSGGLAVDFDSDGLWNYNGARWIRLTTWDAEEMAWWSDGLAVDFGADGLWIYDGSDWTRLTTWDAGDGGMSAWSGGLAVDFDAEGLWSYDGTKWSRLKAWDVGSGGMSAWSGGLAVDFDADGLWSHDGARWTRLTTFDARDALNGWQGSLAVDFDAAGLWSYDGLVWRWLSARDADAMSDAELNQALTPHGRPDATCTSSQRVELP
ncbi:hypothetical protein ThimaDRAFT_0581 [Thiocapsa marina 5811]|uniref:Right handed beta helix domain-containing protein n=1 Tax=Thiocapsa marina 5811 TaxID=768671 RepID=F9U6M9_9GAMM|nr:hypothetical protein ThimaDRAFT_0581 [Thiocapsa marina 5811]